MNTLLTCLLASSFAATANLFFRKSSDKLPGKMDYNYYLLFFYFISLIVSSLLSYSKESAPFNLVMFSVGCLVGILNIMMMWFTSQALKNGPAGLTFAVQNASGIFPGILLFSLFGPSFGFQITFFQILGMILVVWGLFLSSTQKGFFHFLSQFSLGKGQIIGREARLPDEQVEKKEHGHTSSSLWLKYALGCFFAQVLALSLMHWRCLLFAHDVPDHYLIPWALPECSDVWFLPGQFGTTFCLQLGIILLSERRRFVISEAFYGTLGGTANAAAAFCLLISTKTALSLEKGLIFPCFTAATLILCNIWANRCYQERFNFSANLCCALGIFLSSLI